ncbi:ORC1-type DNA replication protein [Nanoarchaeota archaeon]
MIEKGLVGFFKNFLEKDLLFRDKKVLQSNHIPESIPHRQDQIQQVAQILAPALKLQKPSNLFVYGKTGSGKTLSVQYVVDNINQLANEKNIPIKICYLNCKLKKVADTEYRLIAQIANEFGEVIPTTGLPTQEVYKIFFNVIDKNNQLIILVLDEIDQLVEKTGDEVLYNLTRINSELKKAQISLIGISNNLIFTDNLDPRVKSSLSEEEILFPAYNAIQLQDILRERAGKAFKKDAIGSGVIEKCAAYAAREHGDARRALELLRVAAEIAERKGLTKTTIKHIDEAEDKIDSDCVLDLVKTQPKQIQATLYSIIHIFGKRKSKILTGEVYNFYKSICSKIKLRPLTQRRISDIISELDMLGIINGKVISKGRYGRTREISLAIQPTMEPRIKDILEQSLGI